MSKVVVVGWAKPLGEFKPNPVGSHYNFSLKDFLSARPIKGVEVETEDGNLSISNEKGEASLVVEDTKQPEIKVKIRRKLREDMTLDRMTNKLEKLLWYQPQHIVSKSSSKYDLYVMYIDGKDEQKLIAGSGYENQMH